MDRMDLMDLMGLIQWMWLKVARLKGSNGSLTELVVAVVLPGVVHAVCTAHELTQLQVRYPYVQAIRQRDVHSSSRGHRSSFSFC
jgi:hypothetical protein